MFSTIGAVVAAVRDRVNRKTARDHADDLQAAVDRLAACLDSTEASDRERIAGLTAVVNGRVAVLNVMTRGRGIR